MTDMAEAGDKTASGPAPATAAAVPQELAYQEWMAAAVEEYERILNLLRGLRPDQWLAPTDCEGWQVRDIVAHLAGAAAGTAALREQVRQARHARRRGGDTDLVDRMNDLQVEERLAMSPGELLDDLAVAASRGVAGRRRIPRPLRGLRIPFGPPLGTRPLGYLMGRIYTRDAWMHRIDLARATGTELLLTSAHDGAIVEDLVAEWVVSGGFAGYDVTLHGPAGGRWCSGPGATVSIQMDAVDFARTIAGRAAGEGALAHHVPF